MQQVTNKTYILLMLQSFLITHRPAEATQKQRRDRTAEAKAEYSGYYGRNLQLFYSP